MGFGPQKRVWKAGKGTRGKSLRGCVNRDGSQRTRIGIAVRGSRAPAAGGAGTACLPSGVRGNGLHATRGTTRIPQRSCMGRAGAGLRYHRLREGRKSRKMNGHTLGTSLCMGEDPERAAPCVQNVSDRRNPIALHRTLLSCCLADPKDQARLRFPHSGCVEGVPWVCMGQALPRKPGQTWEDLALRTYGL